MSPETGLVPTGGSEVEATLVTEIQRNYDLAIAAAEDAVEHALKVGADLLKLKEIVPHGQWGDYLEEHFDFSHRTAQRWMQLARNPDKTATVAHLGVKGVAEALAEPKTEPNIEMTPEAERHLAEAREALDGIERADHYYRLAACEIQAARAEGRTWAEIAEGTERDETWVRELVDTYGEKDALAQVQAMLPDLEGENWESFRANIAEHGILSPLTIDEDGRIIDGRQRARAARQLGIDPPTITRPGLSDFEKAELCFSCNVVRKSYSADEIEAAQIHDALYEQSETSTTVDTFEPPRNEGVARELASFRKDPDRLAEGSR